MLNNVDLDAVVIIGYIEKGSTLHGQEMGATCSLIFKQVCSTISTSHFVTHESHDTLQSDCLLIGIVCLCIFAWLNVLYLPQLELKYGKPVGMGIIGPGATVRRRCSRLTVCV